MLLSSEASWNTIESVDQTELLEGLDGCLRLIEQVIGGAPESLIPAPVAWTAKCGGVMRMGTKSHRQLLGP